jgi:hypothetical protein
LVGTGERDVATVNDLFDNVALCAAGVRFEGDLRLNQIQLPYILDPFKACKFDSSLKKLPFLAIVELVVAMYALSRLQLLTDLFIHKLFN